MDSTLLLKACQIVGSQKKLAKLIGVKHTRLNAWLNMGIHIPYEYALAIEAVTQGAVQAEDLSPQKAQMTKGNPLVSNALLYNQIQQVLISLIKHDQEYNESLSPIQPLAEEIQTYELLRPIAVDTNYQLIFGRLQLLACKLIGKKFISGWLLNIENLYEKTPPLDLLMVNFTLIERAALGIALENLANNSAYQKYFHAKSLPLETKKRTKEAIIEKLGFGSPVIYEQAKKIHQCNRYELIRAVEIGHLSLSTAIYLINLPLEQQRIMFSFNERNQAARAGQCR